MMKANEQNGEFRSAGEVRIVRTLPGPVERIWEYLTDSEKRSRWFAAGPMEPKTGTKFVLKFHHIKLAPDETPPDDHKETHYTGTTVPCEVTRWDPPRTLAYMFDADSEVTFELTPQGKNVQLVLTHRAKPADVPFMPGYGAGWHTHLAQLVALLEGAPRPPFWPQHAKLRAEYAALQPAVSKA